MFKTSYYGRSLNNWIDDAHKYICESTNQSYKQLNENDQTYTFLKKAIITILSIKRSPSKLSINEIAQIIYENTSIQNTSQCEDQIYDTLSPNIQDNYRILAWYIKETLSSHR